MTAVQTHICNYGRCTCTHLYFHYTGTCWEGCITYSRCTEDQYGLFVEVRFFQLGDLDIPNDLEDKFLRGLILQEEAQTEKYKQEAQVVRKETDAMVGDTSHSQYTYINADGRHGGSHFTVSIHIH